jgi:RimJ/RimL family protein N-acetyltransferase
MNVLEQSPEARRAVDLADCDPWAAVAALRVPLAGTLLVLEPLEQRHAGDLWTAAEGNDWSLVAIDCSSRPAFDRWFDWALRSASTEPAARFAAVRRSDGRAIGSSSYHTIHPEHRRVEIGWTWFAHGEWRRGPNVEAKLLMLEHAFALGFRRVEFKANALNLRSRRALEALPAQFEGVLRKHMVVRGEPRDSAYYSVVEDDWPDVRANLERRLAAHLSKREEGVDT